MINSVGSVRPLSRLERAFLYTPPINGENDFSGQVAIYPPGGYVADLTENPAEASQLMHDLEANRWVDQYTRAVVIEFNVLNPNSKLFNQVIVSFEYTNDGGTLWNVGVDVVQLYRYAGSAAVLTDSRGEYDALALTLGRGRVLIRRISRGRGSAIGDRLRHLCVGHHGLGSGQALSTAFQVFQRGLERAAVVCAGSVLHRCRRLHAAISNYPVVPTGYFHANADPVSPTLT